MGLMAGMLPGIEFARRRRLRPAAEAACAGARRPASLGVFWHDHAHLGSAGFAMIVSCGSMKLMICSRGAACARRRGRRSWTASLGRPRRGWITSSGAGENLSSRGATAREASGSLQREVFTKKCGGRRFSWGRRKEQQQQAECAVCLEEFRGGDVLAHLPCAHRFHWARAVPWVQAASRCPFCRAAVHLADHQLV
ncbi:hypothetical protein VPH35_113065 [Triticum aestivum]